MSVTFCFITLRVLKPVPCTAQATGDSLQLGGMGTHESFIVTWESQHENAQMLQGTSYDLLFILQQFQETIIQWG